MLITLLLLNTLAGDPPKLPEHFQAFEVLIGKDWQASFPGGEMIDVQRFEWMYDGKFMRNPHWVKNAKTGEVVYAGETIYAWDYANKRLAWYYFNTTGGHLVGWVEGTGKDLTAYGVNNAPGGQTSEVKGGMKIAGDHYIGLQYFMKDGVWVEQFRVTYKPISKK